ncbi:MAG: MauE/DoxX family redox-associated membrane protein [Micromonosporaceae bacterium]
MFGALREVQIPLLAALLLLACASKALRAARFRSIDESLGPTTMFPLRLRRPAAMVMCATELSLGLALLATAGRMVPWPSAATFARLGTALLFATATAALVELRAHRPDIGCGCFGELSTTPVSLRTIARSALFTVAAAATVGVRPLRLTEDGIIPGAVHGTLEARLLVAAVVAEAAIICALSPEFGEALVRLGYREPCERRPLSSQRTLAALRASRMWRYHAPMLTSTEPVDMWRELCWRYVVFPGHIDGREAEIVFAIYTRRWGPPIRVAIVDAVTGKVLGGTGQPGRARPPGLAPSNAL